MPDCISIRPYQAIDWHRLCEVHDMARQDELALTVGVEAFRKLTETFQDEGLFDDELVVADLNGVVAGFVAFSQSEVTWLYVDPTFYRQGLGRALLQHAMLNAIGPMRIDLLEGNQPAQALYEKEGFVVAERRDGKLIGNESFSATGIVMVNGN